MRGIATGTSFRRLVAKTLARQFGKAVEAVCAPYQSDLSTRAGTDCAGHATRAFSDADPQCTVLSIDGVGAYDHLLRSSFLQKLHTLPSLQGLLPFVRSVHARSITYVWEDGTGARHQIYQAEEGEQGDPLLLLLFSLGIHDSLCAVDERLRPEDKLFAFLDDVHVVSPPHRTRDGYNILEEQLWTGAGIQLHTGKTRVWNREGTCPPGVEELGDEVWSPSGIKILGTSIGSPEFVRTIIAKRLEDEGRLWDAVAWVPDLQCSWQILLQCAGPRCQHLLRTLPPSQSAECAQCHDDGMMRVMDRLMERLTGTGEEKRVVHQLGFTPSAIGRSRIAERGPNGPGCILGIVGRCIAHAPREASAIGSDHRGEIGRRARRWWMPFGVAKGGRRVCHPQGFVGRILGRLAVWRWTTTIHPHGNGLMAGSSTRLRFPSTTFGRP